ncbi:SusC/RagA family TonB-linked outer membrane protein [Mucilaginibacter aquatilis]|uniref:SusC/RagA family TonB-linked outer membrane protein n=1 Tax=Mucilaginibacter aquatilis TaxID=1517760 RepID=A0A6I4IF72_9SPHI|nr:SusC/RagA family TonB-linked outer membrane protein [Mucilaginibacter aquatilis]MVN92009.1 SusC/RagA family TonB-linked outer membrane protein [Mucilaginibacter aquatilis]
MQNFTKSFGLLLFLCLLGGIKAHAQETDSVSVRLADSIARYKADSTLRAKGPKLSGVIKDAATKRPVSGISIGVPAYSSAISDENGRFTINLPNFDVVLTVSGQGYQEKQVPIKGRKTLPDILLFEGSYNSVYDIARMPFGNVSQSALSGAVSTVNTFGAFEPTSQETSDSYLQGKVAGLDVVRRSGTPNIGANLFLRGYNSLYGGNAPLVLVDGMIYDTYRYNRSLISGHVHNPYSNLDLRDVDNYTILKDATAGIYGTKGANGVILITTNASPDLATKIDFSAYSGYNYVPGSFRLPMMQAGDYRTYLSDLLRTSNLTSSQISALPYMNDDPSQPNYYVYHNNTDWQKRAFKNGFNQNYNLRVSGGDDIARYVLALSYGDNKGITPMTDLSKFGTRFNADLNISRNFTIKANLSFQYNEQNLRDQGLSPSTNQLYLGLVKSPLLRTNDVNAAGVESPNLADTDIFGISNPAAVLANSQALNRNYRFFGNLTFRYQFSRSFAAQSLIGITADKVRETTFMPRAGVANDTTATVVIDSRLGSQTQRLYSLYNDTYLSYNRTFNRVHTLGVYLGARFTHFTTQYNVDRSFNSAIDQLVTVGNGLAATRTVGGDIGKYRWLNNYLSANYQLYNKYIFNFNLTADASSRFGTQADGVSLGGVKMALLPSASVAWVVSSEKFMADINFIEMFKLRASYGLTGNDDIGNYAARQYYTSQNLLGLQGLVRANFGNPMLQWEIGKKLNFGLDAAFFQERLSITADVFRNTTTRMITQEPVASTGGLAYAVTNNSGMRTNGFELSVNGRVISQANFKWDLGFNIAAYRNKITSLPASMRTQYAGATILTEVGRPAGVFYGYKTNGVYTSGNEAAAAGLSYRNSQGALVPLQGGDMRFVDVNNDKVIDAQDMQVIGNPNPDFVGGISTGVTYKRFTVNALFTFSQGNKLYNYTRRQIESGSNYNNQTLAVNNRWRADGQVTPMPRVAFGDPSGNSSFSDRWIEDGSYMRLRTLSVSYDVNLKKARFPKYIKVYATGNNLVTFTKYLGYDPEFAPSENLLLRGIDTTLEPQFRTVQLGVRIGI